MNRLRNIKLKYTYGGAVLGFTIFSLLVNIFAGILGAFLLGFIGYVIDINRDVI